jgi:ferric-dicitrate binding protein FerR (iron transport regulator)
MAALHRDLTRLAVDPDRDPVPALLAKLRWEEAAQSLRRRRRHLPPPAERRGLVAAAVAAAFAAGILAALLSTDRRASRGTPRASSESTPAAPEVVRGTDLPEAPRAGARSRPRAVEVPSWTPPVPQDLPAPPAPVVLPPGPAPEEPRPRPAATTAAVVAAATVLSVSGAARADGTAIEAGAVLTAGQTLWTSGGAVLSLPDATRLYLGPDATARFTAEKTVHLLDGDLAADVTPQPKDDPCVVATALADVRVLGTWLAVSARPGSTRVDVEKGRVQVRRRRDGWTRDVREGQSASVSEGQAPRVRPLPANLVADPGFESDGKRWVGLYHPDGQTFGGISVQTKAARSGSKALELMTSPVPGYDREVHQDFPVAPGDTVDVEGWVKTERLGPRGAKLWLVWLPAGDLAAKTTATLRGKGAVVQEDLLEAVSGTLEWRRVARRVAAPPAARQVRLFLYADPDPSGPGFAWFDDFRLRRFTK